MRLAPIVLKLRLANTRFGNRVVGAVEFELAAKNSLIDEALFVIPLFEDATENRTDPAVDQPLTERFAVIATLKNDTTDKDKTGILAYDELHDIRNEIFKVLVGWDMGFDSHIYYRAGRLLDINRGWLWWQFEFEQKARITADESGFGVLEETTVDDRQQESQLPALEQIYANYILSPNVDLPWTGGDLPLADGFPDVLIPDIAQIIDLSDDPNPGAYGRGYGEAFKINKIVGR